MRSKLRIFIDINETLIRTGEVQPDSILSESSQLIKFKKLCVSLSIKFRGLEVVFLTGNSFEYSRRIEEPLGIKNIEGVNVIIVSENGLLARSFKEGNLWFSNVEKEYITVTSKLIDLLNIEKNLLFYTQGNETRVTIKPTKDYFNDSEISRIIEIANKINISEFCTVYSHKYYIDLDPKWVVNEGKRTRFEGKYSSASKIISVDNSFLNIAIGDSPSDIPMFKAVNEKGGKSFWVSNRMIENNALGQAKTVPFEFTKGVNYVLESLL